MNIIGLDLSLKNTGWALSEASGVFSPPANLDGLPRIKWLLDNIWNVTEGADVIAIEGYSFASNMAYARETAELGGVVRFTLWEAGRVYVDVPPSSLKMFATGKGNADKPSMHLAAIKKLGYEGTSYDEVDALWLMHMAKAHYTQALTTEKQKRALGGVRWPALSKSEGVSKTEPREQIGLQIA